MKKGNRVLAILLALLLAFSVINVQSSASVVEAASVKVTKVTAKDAVTGKKTVVVAKGRTVKIRTTVAVKPNKAANKKLKFKSSNTKVATVTKNGAIKGIKPGKAKITVISQKNNKKKAVINVVVKATAVTSVKIKKPSSTTINVGSKVTLKATVKGKKTSYRTPFWSSSNTKVAKVTQKGVVTALKAGKVKITAKAVDGSGKKSTITLKVVNKKQTTPKPVPINLVSATVVNAQTVQFSLSAAKSLTAGDINIMTKSIPTGKFKRKITIDNISTNNNINYTVVLSDSTRLHLRQYVQVSIPSLTGVKVKEVQYNESTTSYSDEYIVRLKVNQSISSQNYDDEEDYYYDSYGLYFAESEGYYSQSLTGLPAGINYRIKDDRMYLYGAPTKVGITVATYTAEDEVGNKLTRKIKFIVGSDSAISASSKTVYGIASNNRLYSYISAIGGSGDYRYEFTPGTNSYGCYFDEDNDVCGVFDVAGTYNIKVDVTDANNSKLKTTVTVTFVVKQGVALSGIVTDMSGNPIGGAYIRFTNKDKADKYSYDKSAYTDSNGAFSVSLNAGTYDVEASYSSGSADASKAKRYLYSQKITVTKSGYDIKLPLYKVKLSLPQGVSLNDISSNWKDVYGDSYGHGDTLYLKNGTYSLSSEVSSQWYQTSGGVLTTKFTVNNRAVLAAATLSGGAKVSIKGDITLGTAVSGTSNTNIPYYVVYRFKPGETATINYKDNRSNAETSDISVDIYDNTGKSSVTSMDDNDSFMVNAGHEYLVRVRQYDGYSSFTYNFIFTKQSDSEED